MNKRKALIRMANENNSLFMDVLKRFRKMAENVAVGESHLSGDYEILDAGEGKYWEGYGTRFIEIKPVDDEPWTNKINIEFYDKER